MNLKTQELPLRRLKVTVENRGYLPTFPLGGAHAQRAILRVASTDAKTELVIGETVSHLQEFQRLRQWLP